MSSAVWLLLPAGEVWDPRYYGADPEDAVTWRVVRSRGSEPGCALSRVSLAKGEEYPVFRLPPVDCKATIVFPGARGLQRGTTTHALHAAGFRGTVFHVPVHERDNVHLVLRGDGNDAFLVQPHAPSGGPLVTRLNATALDHRRAWRWHGSARAKVRVWHRSIRGTHLVLTLDGSKLRAFILGPGSASPSGVVHAPDARVEACRGGLCATWFEGLSARGMMLGRDGILRPASWRVANPILLLLWAFLAAVGTALGARCAMKLRREARLGRGPTFEGVLDEDGDLLWLGDRDRRVTGCRRARRRPRGRLVLVQGRIHRRAGSPYRDATEWIEVRAVVPAFGPSTWCGPGAAAAAFLAGACATFLGTAMHLLALSPAMSALM